jgi:hypothetical protein
MTKKTVTKQKPAKQRAVKTSSRFKQWHKITAGALSLVVVLSVFVIASQTQLQATTTGPTQTDAVATTYGSIGKWMLQSNGTISNWGGSKYQNKTLDEVINVIIVDPTSTSAAASTTKINSVMSNAGFPSQTGHSNGFKGLINGVVYGQQPTGLNAFSDNVATNQNNHARLFGPANSASGGFVWTGALSTEKPTFFFGILTGHAYVSFNTARDALARGFVASGQTQAASVDLANVYNTTTTTTGDHDGKAVVVVLK